MVILSAIADGIDFRTATVMIVSYFTGVLIKPEQGWSTLRDIKERKYAIVFVTLVSVLGSTGSIETVVHVAIAISVFTSIVDMIINSFTRSIFGNLHITVIVTTVIGMSACTVDSAFNYLLSGISLGYCVAAINDMVKGVKIDCRR